MSQRANMRWSFALFVTPALLIFITFFIYPNTSSFYYAFTRWESFFGAPEYIGLQNFRDMASDDLVKGTLKNSLMLTLFIVFIQNGLALFFAILFNQKLRGMTFFRSVVFVPVLLSSSVVCYMWVYLYSPLDGFFPTFFQFMNLNSLSKINWLGDPRYALLSVAIVGIWQYLGYVMVIYHAGLKTIPAELYEAAEIDGAGTMRRIRTITLPLLAPTLTINILLSIIGCLKYFDQVYLLTGGGPAHTTEVFGTLIYSVAFRGQHLGYGSAISLVLTLIICSISFIQYSIMRRREVQY
jgi:raffinose/stachyose/melibiose transport system permease protein